MVTARAIQEHLANLGHYRGPIDGIIGPGSLAAVAKALGIAAPRRALADPAAFFAGVRKVTGPLDQEQVDSINAILTEAAHHPIGWVAYELATAWHEARFIPQHEWGRGRGKEYGRPGKYGQSQHGRGLVQLTWDRNYEWADERLGLDGALLENFSLALRPDLAAKILVIGMEEGAFTAKKLADYLGERGNVDQFTAARRIVNGTDKARLISGYGVEFQSALDAGRWS